MRATTVVRLGQGVDETGRLAPEAVRRTRDCLAGYAESIQRFGPDRKILIATSALRDAADGYELLAAVEQDLGLPWRVLGGEEEAVTTFRGAICGIAGLAVARPLATSAAIRRAVLVIDIGGGSTELVVGHVPAACYSARTRGHAERPATAAERAAEPATPTFVCSVDAGAVRLTERYFRHDPPSAAEWAAAVRRTRALLRAAVPPHVSSRVGGAVGVAGTITTLVANKLGLRSYRSELVDGEPLHLREIEQAIVLFRRLTSAERGRLPGIQPGREDVILAGALIAREVCLFFGLPGVRCGESDILEGTALQLAGEQRT
jgi:exopolyphosphatase/guanosine-5'-triphosphate,3'-diphosphate pyrophosphatase